MRNEALRQVRHVRSRVLCGPLLRNERADAALRNTSPEEPRVREPRVIHSPGPEDATNPLGAGGSAYVHASCMWRMCVTHRVPLLSTAL